MRSGHGHKVASLYCNFCVDCLHSPPQGTLARKELAKIYILGLSMVLITYLKTSQFRYLGMGVSYFNPDNSSNKEENVKPIIHLWFFFSFFTNVKQQQLWMNCICFVRGKKEKNRKKKRNWWTIPFFFFHYYLFLLEGI